MRFTTENSKERDPFSYLPFAAGPRQVLYIAGKLGRDTI